MDLFCAESSILGFRFILSSVCVCFSCWCKLISASYMLYVVS